jgi:hypothetical protein
MLQRIGICPYLQLATWTKCHDFSPTYCLEAKTFFYMQNKQLKAAIGHYL